MLNKIITQNLITLRILILGFLVSVSIFMMPCTAPVFVLLWPRIVGGSSKVSFCIPVSTNGTILLYYEKLLHLQKKAAPKNPLHGLKATTVFKAHSMLDYSPWIIYFAKCLWSFWAQICLYHNCRGYIQAPALLVTRLPTPVPNT